MDIKQIEQSYLKYKNHIYNFIFRLANDHDVAMDVTQQTFLNALNYDNKIHLTKLWYISLARNIYYVEANRKNTIPFDSIDQSTELNFVSEHYNQLPISIALKDIQITIEKLIGNMPLATKEIMILYFIENLSIIVISNITKRSIIDIKVNLHHARVQFEHNLILAMKGKVTCSNDYCKSYFKLTENMKLLIITKSDQKIINHHISNCHYCIENMEQLKRTGILLNLIPLFIAPAILDEIVYNAHSNNNSKENINNQNDFNSSRILPFINPIVSGFIILICFSRFDNLNTIF